MTCPLCNGTGKITVKVEDAAKNLHAEWRACPFLCEAPDKSMGVGSGTLAGNEMTLEEARELIPLESDNKPFKDYRGKSERVDWRKHYGLKED